MHQSSYAVAFSNTKYLKLQYLCCRFPNGDLTQYTWKSSVWIRNQLDVTLCYPLFLLYKFLNMFRATVCPSSGADDCVVLSPRVGTVPCVHWGVRSTIGLRTPQWTHYLLTGSDSLPAATAQYQHLVITLRSRQLLKMGTWLPETCWATFKGE